MSKSYVTACSREGRVGDASPTPAFSVSPGMGSTIQWYNLAKAILPTNLLNDRMSMLNDNFRGLNDSATPQTLTTSHFQYQNARCVRV